MSEQDRQSAESTAERSGRIKKGLAQLGAYLLILVVAGWVFHQDSQDDKERRADVREQHVEMCQRATENRMAIRSLVVAIDGLGTALVLDGKPRARVTPQEEATLERFDQFRQEMLALLAFPVCDDVRVDIPQ